MSNHTPGPWDAETAYDTGELVPIENSGLVLVVMSATGDVAYIANALDPVEVQNANARLIAAAPDLLEALTNIENDDGRIPSTIWKMRNDAIAKATGTT